jgi:hypothetical protein
MMAPEPSRDGLAMNYSPAQGWVVHYTPSLPGVRVAFHVDEECAQRHADSAKPSRVRVRGPIALSEARSRFLIRECTNCVPKHQIDRVNTSLFEPPIVGAPGLGKRR